jgi:hypothetical protein
MADFDISNIETTRKLIFIIKVHAAAKSNQLLLFSV